VATVTLTKGGNAPLSGERVRVVVVTGAALDVSALLCTEAGKVRSDEDMVFYNQPTGPGVSYSPDGVEVVFAAVPAAIDKVVVTASLDGSGPATFGRAGPVRVLVQAAGRTEALVEFTAEGLTTETALVCAEVYRRQGGWKVRAVGQGYASGLAGIATDFGITVDDVPAMSTAAAPTAPAVPSYTRPSATRPSATAPVNLDKGRVSLTKRQTVSLTKTGAAPLSRVTMGLGWDPARQGASIDLDASVIAFDARGSAVDKAWFMAKTALGGAIRHSGDNLTGEGEGDDEQIVVDLDRIPAGVVALMFTVTSFGGQTFNEIRSAFCRLVDANGAELVRFDLSDTKASTGVVMCSMYRETGSTAWSMTALGEFADGRTVRAMVAPAKALLGVR
jgi:stress response protein SCP2